MENERSHLSGSTFRRAACGTLVGLLCVGTAGLYANEIYNGEIGRDLMLGAAGDGHTWLLSTMDTIGVDINENQERFLRRAVEGGHLDTVQWLIVKGADPRANEDEPFRTAARDGYVELVRYFLEAGADVHAELDGALMAAALNNHLDVVKILLDSGSDPRAIRDIEQRCRLVESVSSDEIKSELGITGCHPRP